jgi:beta-glucosidase
VQLYLTYPDSTPNKMPIRSLRGFEKPYLKPGESQTVTFELRNKDLSVWDVVKQGWLLPQGQFEVSVGSSSRKLPLKASFSV